MYEIGIHSSIIFKKERKKERQTRSTGYFLVERVAYMYRVVDVFLGLAFLGPSGPRIRRSEGTQHKHSDISITQQHVTSARRNNPGEAEQTFLAPARGKAPPSSCRFSTPNGFLV